MKVRDNEIQAVVRGVGGGGGGVVYVELAQGGRWLVLAHFMFIGDARLFSSSRGDYPRPAFKLLDVCTELCREQDGTRVIYGTEVAEARLPAEVSV